MNKENKNINSVWCWYDDANADVEANKKLSPIVWIVFKRKKTQYFTRVYITILFQSVKTIRLNATHYFIMKLPNKWEVQQIASNHSSDIKFKDFIKLYKNFTKKLYSFLVNDTTLPLDNPLRFRKNLESLLVKKPKQSIIQSSKTKLNDI